MAGTSSTMDGSKLTTVTEEGPKEELGEEQIAELKLTFDMFDKNGDGTLSVKELGMAMKAFGQNPTEAELQDMIMVADRDGNGVLDFEEFKSLMVNKYTFSESEDELREAFSVFDHDDKGFITAEDLKLVMNNLGENMSDTEISEIIKEADADGDGQVNLEDFLLMMNYNKPIES